MKKIAILLSGCGVYDGGEIHESVMLMFAAAKMGVAYQLFAPDIEQYHVINHLTGEQIKEKRNVLIESARIARGNVKPLNEYKAKDYDGLGIPGGYGSAKNLCTFAIDGVNMKVQPEVERAVTETHKAGKPIAALCIAPVLITKIIKGAKVTIGNDKATAEVIKTLGGTHTETTVTGVAVDEVNKIVTTPCYMLADNISQIAEGAENLMKAMIELM